ncbi:MAG: respiratory nitrate reductase subunit gamma [Alphaproteobacteria bacterium]|nr:respiratory nitrate reductase subunit gamma [Alphaproteobacteria bacterium]MBK9585746.1 respiratory nitrate reductase subunit gamma [Alphaproteobacteria bacterium]MBP7758325.1 respiratory nitrate reductase subunit gamma [Alphaproteobacteria bacterium]MBP7761532.1 respiratory nitrate reductase subunit gamma [Alphaproteobacteria bacterium]MBP7905117.1 respiratory nitrate reductase subunit gamma [Alphaproteobacteria bacterium]
MGGFWNFFLFQIFPYIAIFIFLLGCVLRFDRDPYSWRTKSSQLLRRKQLILGSVLFHLGILVILAGHAVGLLTPIQVFDAIGISHGAKQVLAITAGGIAGIFCLIGLLLLLHRRLYDPRIRKNSSFADIAVLVLLLAQLLLGLMTIPVSMHHLDGHEMVKFMNWAQHIVTFRGNAHLFLTDVALVFKMHITLGLFLLVIFPFTRLVHALSAPLGYVARPYQIVRKRAT